jgi:hypothetical protein
LVIHIISKLVSMTTKKDNRGGPRPNSGRPSKIQEIKLIESMDRIAVPEDIWAALLFKIQQGDTQAIKLWLSYRLGLPKQQIDVTTNGESIAPPIQWIGKGIEYNQAESIEFEELQRIETEPLTRLDE